VDSKTLLARLVTEGVLVENDDTVSVSDSFEAALKNAESSLAETDSVEEYLAEIADDDRVSQVLREVATQDRDIVVRYLALQSYVEDLSHSEAVRALIGLETLQRSPPRSSGAPASFVPVYGDQLPYLLEFVQRAVVYIWRHDCEPCDVMVETFDEVVDTSPQDVALFAIYGPESAQLLEDAYDIQGGPATLFVVGGRVDSRVYGATYPGVIEHELNHIRSK